MRIVIILLTASLFMSGAVCSSLAGVPSPLRGDGEFSFSADMPVFFDGERARVDLAVLVYHPQMTFQSFPDGSLAANLQLHVKLARRGLVAVDRAERFVLRADTRREANDPARFQLLELGIPLEPGRWAVTLTLRDLAAEKDQLSLDQVVSVAQGVLDVPDFASEAVSLSDLEFRLGELPNPERLYGVAQDTLDAYLELNGALAQRQYRVKVSVFDPVFGGMDEQVLSLAPADGRTAAIYRLPLGEFPEGSYVLRLTPEWMGGGGSDYEFSVSWKVDRAVQSAQDVGVEAALLLEGETYNTFRRLSRPAQVQFMQEFWNRHDPTPGTVQNEVYDRFRARLDYCNRNYTRGGMPGAVTDRGRIYVQYGPPSTTSVEVVPSNGHDLDQAIAEVHDTHEVNLPGSFTKDSLLRANEVVRDPELIGLAEDRRRNLMGVGQEGAFELWEYELDGDPLLPVTSGWSENVDLRFLFVDRAGSGDYRLEFTNVPLQH